MSIIENISEFSGLKHNIEKATVVWIGSNARNNYTLCRDKKINWSQNTFTFLGVNFNFDFDDIVDLNHTGTLRLL